MSQFPTDPSILDLLPADWRAPFSAPVPADAGLPEAGLYFSSYVGWHRLLRLAPHQAFQLLLWRTDRDGRPMKSDVRSYDGDAKITRFGSGDRRVDLDFGSGGVELGGDRWDTSLYPVDDGPAARLLQKRAVSDFATSIGWNSTLGRSDRYFTRVEGLHCQPDLQLHQVAAPPLAALPQSIQRLVPKTPLQATILSVGKVPARSEPDTTPIMVVIDKGSEAGFRHNMPLAASIGAERPLIGWCSAPEAQCCPVRMRVQRGEAGRPVHLPKVGDCLTSRAPGAPPLR